MPHRTTDPNQMPRISAIITCYYEEKTVEEFHARLSAALKATGRPFEIIFVNDGSTDKTFKKLEAIYLMDPSVSAIVDLFKNSGQANAITAGMQYANGDVFLLLDSDLQLDPEELPLLLAEYDKGADIVAGYRAERKDSLFRTIPSLIANLIMRRVARCDLRDFGCTFKLFNAKLMRAFEFGPMKPLQIPQVFAKAQRIAQVPVSHHPRKFGKSGFTFAKLFAYNMDNFVSISEKPFQVLGILCFLFAALFFLRIALAYVVPVSVLKIVTNGLILNVMVFFFLATTAILAMIGEFAIRCFYMLARYPFYIVRTVIQR